ncbi:hypothetical protein KM043_012506 [Ampulex compressa]|nr:hypothetical protein KM043_012506 [Ampulex compressa]
MPGEKEGSKGTIIDYGTGRGGEIHFLPHLDPGIWVRLYVYNLLRHQAHRGYLGYCGVFFVDCTIRKSNYTPVPTPSDILPPSRLEASLPRRLTPSKFELAGAKTVYSASAC